MVAPVPGQVVFEGPVASEFLGGERLVRIYLPPSYRARSKMRFPVLYVHDGQNAFSTVGEHVAFGWGNWRLDKTVDHLIAARQMREIIMVAIDCSHQRYAEYRGPAYGSHWPGQPDAPRLSAANRAYVNYSRFLLHELKPRIDREYRTVPGPEDTASLGSSMGGVCSFALAWEFPHLVGRAASLSGAFQVERRQLLRVLRNCSSLTAHDPTRRLQIYLDSGTIDGSDGDDGKVHTAAVARELRRLGWKNGTDLLHFVDGRIPTDVELAAAGLPQHKWHEAKISQHNEFYWRLRAWRPLVFLFPRRKRTVTPHAKLPR